VPPNIWALAVGAAVDVSQAISMVGLAVADSRRRCLAIAGAGAALAFAAAGRRSKHRITVSDARST